MEKIEATQTQSKEELLKAVADVLEEALAEYEALSKADLYMGEPEEGAPIAESKDEESEESEEEKEKKKKKKDEDESEDEESEEALKSEFAAISAKMAARGLLNKSQETKSETIAAKVEAHKAETATIQKSEAAPVAPAEDKTESLKKAFDERFDSVSKAIAALSETVNKIAAQPASPRKGVAGYAPSLRKSEEGSEQPLKKSVVLEVLLKAKREGNRGVDSTLINRIETNRATPADLQFVKGLLG